MGWMLCNRHLLVKRATHSKKRFIGLIQNFIKEGCSFFIDNVPDQARSKHVAILWKLDCPGFSNSFFFSLFLYLRVCSFAHFGKKRERGVKEEK
jgi:hypothetical protein